VQSQAPEKSVQNQLFVHFGLRENPFGGTPDPRFLFHSETHREALASLINGIDYEFGFQVLVAQPGMGKTTLLFSFLERFRETAHTAFLFQPQLAPHELLQSLLLELGEVSEDTSVRKLSEQINHVLGRSAQEHKRVIVVVDEAQNLDFAVLETLRQLSNFETARAKLMQIVLAGQPELVKKLAAPEQEQLRQRISTISRLSPLTYNESRAYINHRLRTAGYRGSELFSPSAARNIWEHGNGVPRKINTLCFNAMLLAFAANARLIDETVLEEAARDLDMPSVLADIYRTGPSLVASRRGGNSKVQPVGEGQPSNNLVAAEDGISQRAEINPAAAISGNGNSGGAGQNIPPALIEAIARISQTLEEQKILLAAKSVPSVEASTATVSTPAATVLAPAAPMSTITPIARENPVGSSQVLQAGPSTANANTTAAISRDSSAKVEKNSQLKTEKTVAGQKLDRGTATPHPEKTAAAPNVLPASPVVRSSRSEAKKSSESGGFWPKALVLVAITAILTFVIVQKSQWQNPAQANATEKQGESTAGYFENKESAASPTDAQMRTSKVTDSSAPRESGSDRSGSDKFDDVTVRTFPAEPAVTPGGAAGVQDSKAVFFDQDSAAISRQYRSALQQIADALSKDPRASAILEGHTDDTGPEAYNMELSSRRAIAVRNTLISEFNVSSEQLTAMGSGSAAPVRPNSNAAGRAYNRRVAVRFVRLGE
jgi:type II secretory pathway predicted ATPase ExeA/outer membrane protein OmpA-like peptidoglycan-associated protein